MEPEAERLYRIYSSWSGGLHHWCATKLGLHVDAEFFPMEWKFKVYSGAAESEVSLFGVPKLIRPQGERSFTLKLPGPDDAPTDDELDRTFRNICLATARMLEIDLGVPKLGGHKKPRKLKHGNPPRTLPPPDPPDE